MSARPDYVVVADPNSLRWQHYSAELRDFLQPFRPQPRIHLVPWNELIKAKGDLSAWCPAGPFLLRIESPARNFEIFRGLLQLGQQELGETTTPWGYDKGWITSPHRLHLGFCRVLSNLSEWVASHSACWPTSSLADTQSLFDKNHVSQKLRDHSVVTPDAFQPRNLQDINSEMLRRGWSEAFLKLAFGSCASGIVRVRRDEHARFQTDTAISRIGNRFYNSFQVESVTEPEFRRTAQFVINETATVQQAVDKTRVHGDGFDVRVVVVAREVAATVFRASPLPMTNLHLGGYRADPVLCRHSISDRAWADGMENCRLVSDLFQLAALGIDLAFDSQTGQPQVLEVNSFGDFFPRWRDRRGRTVHRIEIEATAARFQNGAGM